MRLVILLVTTLVASPGLGQEPMTGLRGDPEAIAEAEAMVESMGGRSIWSQMTTVRFVHEWFFWNRVDSYIENEILDLSGPRSWVEMKSEIYHRLRAYSPEHKYWNVVNGEFAYASDEQFREAQARAPFHFVRIAKAIAVGNPWYEVRFGEGEFPNTRRLEFFDPEGNIGGWILLNARKEPLVWATNQYTYTFGPMEQFGNLRVPVWGSTSGGAVTYMMISLTGDHQPLDRSLFAPPREHLPRGD